MNRSGSLALALLAGIFALTAVNASDLATPSSDATPFNCPVTEPNGIQPPASANVFGRGSGDLGNEYLWTSLWIWGEGVIGLPPGDEHVGPDGSFRELKWAWYRFAEGNLIITGHRLDNDSEPLEAHVPYGYGGTGFQVSGITFPSTGCWKVIGTLDTGGSLTFVVEVKVIDPATPVATPV